MTDHLSAEHEQLRATIRQFLAAAAPEAHVRELMETDDAHDPAIWKRLAGELGLTGLAIPEEFGGSGFGLTELGIVGEELGRALLPCPLLAGVLASAAILTTDDHDAAARYLPGIADGTTLATLVVSASGAGWNPGAAPQAVRDGAHWRVTGGQRLVLDAQLADLLVVFARSDAGPALYAVEKGAEGVHIEPEPGLDRTRRLAGVTFADAPGRKIGESFAAVPAVEHALRTGTVMLAAEQVGGCDRVLAMTRDYALQRHQFGRPIGSFQVIKHMLADMLVETELARSAYLGAVGQDSAVSAGVAKSTCSAAYVAVASAAIQVHGGIGFTWEHPAHLYFKRATSDRILFGSPDFHRERVAAALGI